MDYKQKYLKYKSKYLHLKKQIGGDYQVLFDNCLKITKEDIREEERNNIYEGIKRDNLITVLTDKPRKYEIIENKNIIRCKLNIEIDFDFNENNENYNKLMDIFKLYNINDGDLTAENLNKITLDDKYTQEYCINYLKWFFSLGYFFQTEIKKYNALLYYDKDNFFLLNESEKVTEFDNTINTRESVNVKIVFIHTGENISITIDFDTEDTDIKKKERIMIALLRIKEFYVNKRVKNNWALDEYIPSILDGENGYTTYIKSNQNIILTEDFFEKSKINISKQKLKIENYIYKHIIPSEYNEVTAISVSGPGITSYLQMCFIYLYRFNENNPLLFNNLVNCLIKLVNEYDNIHIINLNNNYTNFFEINSKTINIIDKSIPIPITKNKSNINILQFFIINMPLLKFCLIYNGNNGNNYNFDQVITELKDEWSVNDYQESVNSGLKFYTTLKYKLNQLIDDSKNELLNNLLYTYIKIINDDSDENEKRLEYLLELLKDDPMLITKELKKCPEISFKKDDDAKQNFIKFNHSSTSHFWFDPKHFVTHIIGLNNQSNEVYRLKNENEYYDTITAVRRFLVDDKKISFDLNFFTVIKLGYYELYKNNNCEDKNIDFNLLN